MRQQCALEAVSEHFLYSFPLKHSSSHVEMPSRPTSRLLKRTSEFLDEVGIFQKLVNGCESLEALRSHLQIESERRRAPARGRSDPRLDPPNPPKISKNPSYENCSHFWDFFPQNQTMSNISLNYVHIHRKIQRIRIPH